MDPNFNRTSQQITTILDAVRERRLSRDFHDASIDALQAAGFDPVREFLIRLDRRRGFIDIVLDGWYALELDHVTPRVKSIRKVRTFGCGMVYCRRARPGDAPYLIWL